MSTYASNFQWTPASIPLAIPRVSTGARSVLSPREVLQQLQALVASQNSFQQVLKDTAQIVVSSSACVDFWVVKKDGQDVFSEFTSLTAKTKHDHELSFQWLSPICDAVKASNHLLSETLELENRKLLVAAPLRVNPNGETPELILLGLFESDTAHGMDPIWITTVAAESTNRWIQARAWSRAEQEKRSVDEKLKAILQLSQSQNFGQAARILVNSFRRIIGAQQVSLMVQGALVAVSDVETLDHRSEATESIRSACDISQRVGKSLCFSTHGTETDPFLLPLESYCRANRFEACVSLPLSMLNQSNPTNDSGHCSPQTSLLVAGDIECLSGESGLTKLEELARALGQSFELTLRAHRTPASIGRDWIASIVRHRWRKMVIGILLGLLALLAIPMPYRIHCNCEVQPVSKRFVVAPFESVLERSFVKNGDVVARDQLLAQLDGRQLRIELAGLQAELAGARKRFDSELAAGNVAQSQIAKSESDRLKAKINLLHKRTESLEIRSPIDGVVVIGDLDKAEGASLKIGQALFEIAPLDQMHVEVAVPESEIQYAKPEMPVTVKLNAFPFETWQAQIQLIHPSAEIIDNQNVFIAQALVQNVDGSLRPGMKGKAKIRSQWAPLGWSMFHRSWESLRYWALW